MEKPSKHFAWSVKELKNGISKIPYHYKHNLMR
jgi:hypothetical protein